MCEDVLLDMCGIDLKSICGSAKQDRAALSVVGFLGMEEREACDTHDGDKIGKSVIGDLT